MSDTKKILIAGAALIAVAVVTGIAACYVLAKEFECEISEEDEDGACPDCKDDTEVECPEKCEPASDPSDSPTDSELSEVNP